MADYAQIRKSVLDAVSNGSPFDIKIFEKFGRDIGFYHRKTVTPTNAVVATTEFFTATSDDLTSNLGTGGKVSAPFWARAISMSMFHVGAVTLAEAYDLLEVMKGSRYYHLRDTDRVIDMCTEVLFEIDQIGTVGTDAGPVAVRIKTKTKPVNGELVFIPDNNFKGFLDVPEISGSLALEVTPQIHGLILR